MPGIGAIYGSLRRPTPPARVRELAPGAEVLALAGEEDDWSRIEVRWPDLSVSLNRLAAGDPRHAQQVQALLGAVLHTARTALEGRVTPHLHKLLRKIAGAQHVVGVAAEPGLELAEPRARAEALLRGVAADLNGVVFQSGRVLDAELRTVLGPEGEADEAADLPDLPSARDRKARSEERLASLGLSPPDLPPLPGDEEVRLRSAGEVAGRAQALWAVAARARGVERDQAVDLLQKRGLWDAATERERSFLLDEEPKLIERTHYAAQGDALQALLWALGHVAASPPPREPTPLDRLTKALMKIPAQTFVAEARLRPLSELLDEADLVYRCHGLAGQAALRGEAPPGDLDPAVLRERHAALFWVIRYMEHPWDLLAANPE